MIFFLFYYVIWFSKYISSFFDFMCQKQNSDFFRGNGGEMKVSGCRIVKQIQGAPRLLVFSLYYIQKVSWLKISFALSTNFSNFSQLLLADKIGFHVMIWWFETEWSLHGLVTNQPFRTDFLSQHHEWRNPIWLAVILKIDSNTKQTEVLVWKRLGSFTTWTCLFWLNFRIP